MRALFRIYVHDATRLRWHCSLQRRSQQLGVPSVSLCPSAHPTPITPSFRHPRRTCCRLAPVFSSRSALLLSATQACRAGASGAPALRDGRRATAAAAAATTTAAACRAGGCWRRGGGWRAQRTGRRERRARMRCGCCRARCRRAVRRRRRAAASAASGRCSCGGWRFAWRFTWRRRRRRSGGACRAACAGVACVWLCAQRGRVRAAGHHRPRPVWRSLQCTLQADRRGGRFEED
jgi:hypothetical protein